MKKYDIAHSELTYCYYIMCDGKKVAECTEQIENIRAAAKAEVIDEILKYYESSFGGLVVPVRKIKQIKAEIMEQLKEQKE